MRSTVWEKGECMKRVRRWFALVIVGGGLLAATPAAATVWKNLAGELYCLDIANSSSNEGAAVVISLCNGGLSQSWTSDPYPHDTSYGAFRSQLNVNLVTGLVQGWIGNGTN